MAIHPKDIEVCWMIIKIFLWSVFNRSSNSSIYFHGCNLWSWRMENKKSTIIFIGFTKYGNFLISQFFKRNKLQKISNTLENQIHMKTGGVRPRLYCLSEKHGALDCENIINSLYQLIRQFGLLSKNPQIKQKALLWTHGKRSHILTALTKLLIGM